ncbi:MAG: hypothetical protein RJA44_2061 [Pseudomonadota bacterium]|jgi:uncharacterized protein
MARVFWWLVLGLLGWVLWRSTRQPSRTDTSAREVQLRRQPGAAASPQAMLACARCGVHLPAAEALCDVDGQPYCSAAHRDAGPPR